MKKKKLTEMPLADSLNGLLTYGVDANNKDVAVSLGFVQDAADGANAAKENASKAVEDAQSAVQIATDASANATKAVNTANTASEAAEAATKSASEAASSANSSAASAKSAAESANTAAASANSAATKASSAASDANTAAASANDAATKANDATTNYKTAYDDVTAATSAATSAAESANTAASAASTNATKAEQAAALANAAAAAAQEIVDGNGGGTVKSVTVNGEKHEADEDGDIAITVVTDMEVDESLDVDSTNPVENRAVAAKLSELEASAIYGASADLSDDGSTVHLSLTNKSGAEAIGVDFPAGSGEGSGDSDSSSTKIVLGASIDKTTIKEGSAATLTYTYDHQYSSGDDKGMTTGQKATLTISVKRGTTTTYEVSKSDVSKGTYTLDLTKYLLLGTNDIYIVATTTDASTGKTQKKQAYVSIKVVSLTLTSSYNPATSLASGGYTSSDTIEIPYAVSGSGTKVVALYVDGVQKDANTVTRSGTTNSSFTFAASTLSEGRHSVQLLTEMETDDGTIKSDSIYIDVQRRGTDATAFVSVMATYEDGHIVSGQPSIEVEQYDVCSFNFVAYDPEGTPATLKIYRDGTLQQTMNVPRTLQTYSNRFTEQGTYTLKLVVASFEYTLPIEVTESDVDIAEASYGLLFKLDAAGRSNDEATPGVWSAGNVSTDFEEVNWSSNGWVDNTLKLTNGAKATINYKPFATDVKSTGLTLEITMRVSNVTDRSASVISCVDEGKGLLITTQEASFKTGQSVTYTNEDDEVVSRETKLATNYAADEWIKVALIIRTSADNRLMELYINGNRTGADIYDSSFSFKQETPQVITIDSDAADVEIKNIRVYNRALSDDEELENRIVDCDTTDEMVEVYEANNIIGENGDIDIDILRSQGKGVLRIVRSGKLDDVYAANNKKTDFTADIYYYSALGSEFDFVLLNCYIRIQGTSSTKYPSKNIRIYCAKGVTNKLSMSGTHVSSGNKYTMRAGAKAMNLFCLKSDYSDSSMSLNTGGAKLFNDMMKELGLLTPPQQFQYNQNGTMNDVSVRSAIDGMPIDVFVAETTDGENSYVGQYNFNNEKSKSGALFGMEGVDGYTPACPITLEMLNNTSPICLFQSTNDTDLVANFDAGAEVNYGIDASGNVQTDGDVAWSGLGSDAQTAIKRLYTWIRSCVPSGATSGDLSTFVSEKFVNEIDQYLNRDFVLTYYLFTDYFLSVDQRAKNMMLRTWDGLIWYITYYDGDTQLGKRNDCFLVYGYTTDRNTYDAEASKYAFEGRDSWLWNLVLANLEDELKTCATKMRAVLTNTKVLAMLNDEQSGNWSDRAFNKSGYLKYIQPNIQEMYGKVWPFIYALQGSNKSHRTFFIENRFAMLDAKYGTNNFTSDNIDLYLSRTTSDAADVLKITAGEVYAFGYGTNNSANIANTGLVEAGVTASVSISGAYTVNDPLRVYGASRIQVLDMTGAASHLKNGLELGKCTQLQELNLSAASGKGSTGWWLTIDGCLQLRRLYLTNQSQAKTGSSTSTALDLSKQTKLEVLEAAGTSVRSVVFAKGAPVTNVILPSTLTTLRLEYLSKLTDAGFTISGGYGNIETFIFDTCPQLDWETMFSKMTSLKRLRVTGINKEDDGTWLNKFMSLGGIDSDGSQTETCALVGTVHLTRYMDEDRYVELTAHFPELNIVQPEYTMIEFADEVADDANVSNLDNGTGYKYGTDYVVSGHISKILAKRHRVLAKITKKPTSRTVSIAGQTTTMNNLDGEATYFPLHDENSNYYADATSVSDCTAAKLDSTEGDIMMYEPGMWIKGVNDYLNGKHYSCYSSQDKDHKPTTPEATIITLAEIKSAGNYTSSKKIVGKDTLSASLSSDSSYAICKVDVTGYKRVRFPSVPGTGLVGSVFCDAAGNVLENVIVSTLSSRFEAGMYLIKDIPDGAVTLHFSILTTAEFGKVVLSNSTKVEDMEPEWYYDDEHLCAVVGSSVVGTKLRACVTGGSTTASLTWTDFHYYSAQRGMQQIDAMMHSRIANLFYAKYGRRDSQTQCGGGSHTNTRTTGGTMSHGMQDTIGYQEAYTINTGITKSMIDDCVYQYAWYRQSDGYGTISVTQISNICCLGYEDIYGHKWDMMDGVDLPNDSGNTYKWRIWMPDGTTRMVKGATTNGQWITGVAHGLYMDMVPVGTQSGSNTTYFCDAYYINSSAARVVYRGSNSASSNGGVSSASANSDASNSNASFGSRLAFRGEIVKAQSVAAYKLLVEVA